MNDKLEQWKHVPTGTPVMVRDKGRNTFWYKRHFIEVSKEGKFVTYAGPASTFTALDYGGTQEWDICRLPVLSDFK